MLLTKNESMAINTGLSQCSASIIYTSVFIWEFI